MQTTGHGMLCEVTKEKDVFDHTNNSKYAVVHFMKKDFKRCAILNKHLTVKKHKQLNSMLVLPFAGSLADLNPNLKFI